MPAHRPTNRETEIKLRVTNMHDTLQKLHGIGARYVSRVLERNTLYDTPDSDFRNRGSLLRIRVEFPASRTGHRAASRLQRTILTSKAPSAQPALKSTRRYKEKLERELLLRQSPARWNGILCSLGLRPGFRYEKYRTTFRLPGLALELDETPAGTFLELEGTPPAIDRAALSLGYSHRDYYRGTYWDVYAADCRHHGRTPRNMLFHSKKIL